MKNLNFQAMDYAKIVEKSASYIARSKEYQNSNGWIHEFANLFAAKAISCCAFDSDTFPDLSVKQMQELNREIVNINTRLEELESVFLTDSNLKDFTENAVVKSPKKVKKIQKEAKKSVKTLEKKVTEPSPKKVKKIQNEEKKSVTRQTTPNSTQDKQRVGSPDFDAFMHKFKGMTSDSVEMDIGDDVKPCPDESHTHNFVWEWHQSWLKAQMRYVIQSLKKQGRKIVDPL